jgi:hypothetical protein
MQEVVVDPEDRPIGGHRELGIVDLLAFLGRGEEAFVTVLDPLHGPPELKRNPGQDDLLPVEHDLRPEAATDERGDHADL